MRIKEIEFLKENIKRKRSVLIIGRRGSGKTWLISQLDGIYIEYPSSKLILKAIVKNKEIETERSPRYMTVSELLNIVRPYLKETVLMLDDFDNARKPVKRLVEKMVMQDATVIACARRKVWASFFKDNLKIGPLNKSEAESIIYENIKETDQIAVDLIFTKSLGYPGKIIDMIKTYNIGIENMDVNPWDKKDILNFFTGIKPEFPEKMDILPFEYLFVIGFGALIIKYIFWDKGDWRTGYLMGGIGYLVLITWRTLVYKKRRRY